MNSIVSLEGGYSVPYSYPCRLYQRLTPNACVINLFIGWNPKPYPESLMLRIDYRSELGFDKGLLAVFACLMLVSAML